MKKCPFCKEFKSFDKFWNNKSTNDGLCCYCKTCTKIKRPKIPYTDRMREAKKEHYFKNKDKIRVRSKEYRKNNKHIIKSQQSKWYIQNKERLTDYKLKKTYNISLEQYNNILNSQNNSCAICSGVPNCEFRLAVDHCHKTNKIRGLLCANCNRGLGLFKDSIENFNKAIKYLTKI